MKQVSYKESFNPEYFSKRTGNDSKRTKMFSQESKRLLNHIAEGVILDVGCSTGEFLSQLDWKGEKYGMEISEHAIKIAEEEGIKFDLNLLNTNSHFDCILFRGTIQHIDTPFYYMKKAYDALKPGGWIVFLASPNADSLYYRLFKTLPFIDNTPNFYISSEKSLCNSLKHYGFDIREKSFPYLGTPYAKPIRDHIQFTLKIFGFSFKPAFWKNSIEVYAQKPLEIIR